MSNNYKCQIIISVGITILYFCSKVIKSDFLTLNNNKKKFLKWFKQELAIIIH